MKVFTFPTYPLRKLSVLSFDRVINPEVVLQKLLNGDLNAAIINPEFVVSWFQIFVAAVGVLDAEVHGSLKTHTIHAELVYRLAASNNITNSLKNLE